jgi:hypothetical protein
LFANCNWFFQGLIAVGGEYGIANGSCDKLWFHYDFFLWCRDYEFMASNGIRGRNLIEIVEDLLDFKELNQFSFHWPTNMTNVTTNHVSHRLIMPWNHCQLQTFCHSEFIARGCAERR